MIEHPDFIDYEVEFLEEEEGEGGGRTEESGDVTSGGINNKYRVCKGSLVDRIL